MDMTTLEMDSTAGPWPPLEPTHFHWQYMGDWGQTKKNLHHGECQELLARGQGGRNQFSFGEGGEGNVGTWKQFAWWLINSSVIFFVA